MKRSRGLALAALASVIGATSSVHAEGLRDVAARAKDTWTRADAEIVETAPRFVFEEETVNVLLPKPVRTTGSYCTTVALVGARGLGFRAHFVRGSVHDDDAVASAAGIAELTSCDSVVPDRVVVTAVSGRGAIEIVTAYSRRALVSVRTIYPERAGALIPSIPEPGPLGPMQPLQKRVEQAEARARNDGAAVGAPLAVPVDGEGSGSFRIPLDPGCHRIELFGAEPKPVNGKILRLDVDAELRDSDDDSVLARDRSELADAHLDACVGGDTLGEVFFAGAAPKSELIVSRAIWTIPEHLPLAWGRETRARMAAALLARRAPKLASEPIFLTQGPAGVTPVPFAVETGACYVAVAAIAHGTPRGLGMRAVAGNETAADDRGLNDDSGALAFCARESDRAKVVVDARGVSLAWALAVYRVAGHAKVDR